MEFMLVSIEGTLKGCSFPLGDELCSFGRDPGNMIQIAEQSVSRQHCTVRRQSPEMFLLTDLGSRNGTLRNGAPVTECLLQAGDEIRVGDSRFLFLVREEPGEMVSLDDLDPPAETIVTIAVQPEEVVYLRLGLGEMEPAPSDPLGRGVSLLWQLSSTVWMASGLEELGRRLLGSLGDCVPAQSSAVILFENGLEQPSWVCGFPASSSREPVAHFPRSLILRAFTERVAAFANRNVADAGELPKSILVAPLLAGPKALGVLCLAHSDPAVRFDRSHLQLAAAVGALAGPAFLEALRFARLEAENRRLQREIDLDHDMIGESAPALELYHFIAKAAPADSTVLICGESGTGKELAARALHRNSARAPGPFVAVNCASLTESLVESELFGHEKGAFTGAFAQKRGKLEIADGGTFFLDEIGELPLSLQAKLLRALQERAFERVGGTRPIHVDVRFIAATNRNLRDLIAKGSFRQDLYYRLNVVTLRMPSLRERGEDILLLAEHFLRKLSAQVKRPVRGICPKARNLLAAYHWPGNIRELENAIERAVVIGGDDFIIPEDLPQEILDSVSTPQALNGGFHDAVRAAKRSLILDAMHRASGSYTEAAQLLDLNPTYLHRLIGNLDLKSEIKRMLPSLADRSKGE
jgi:transcriptional regulator with GAF, ATPase, and Fis domain/pSer/pThr/pTyr-binding forkhead associated (FHA) protein